MLMTAPRCVSTWPRCARSLVFTVILGLAYPLAVTGVAQVAVTRQGRRLAGHAHDGQIVGSRADRPELHRRGRHAAAGVVPAPPVRGRRDGLRPARVRRVQPRPGEPDLVAAIEERRAQVAAFNGVPEADVPADAVTASRLRARPRHQPGVRPPPGRPGRQGARPGRRSGPRTGGRPDRRPGTGLRRRPTRERARTQPGTRTPSLTAVTHPPHAALGDIFGAIAPKMSPKPGEVPATRARAGRSAERCWNDRMLGFWMTPSRISIGAPDRVVARPRRAGPVEDRPQVREQRLADLPGGGVPQVGRAVVDARSSGRCRRP